MAWDDEKKSKAVEMYLALEPTPDNSMECVKEVAEKLGESPNGTRMILSKAEVYVKKEATKGGEKKEAGEGKTSTRVSKESAIADLTATIEELGLTVDADILTKLTGKAAVYFNDTLKKASK